MDESTLTNSENDSFYSRDTVNTISDCEISEVEKSKFSLQKLITSIANVLIEIIQENSTTSNASYIKKDFFFSKQIPKISLEDYIKRIVTLSNIEIPTLISSIMYIDRLCERNTYVLCNNNIHRIFLSAIVVSAKINEDRHVSSGDFAKIGGVSIEEMNNLEYKFCSYLDYNLYISQEYYDKYFTFFQSCQCKAE